MVPCEVNKVLKGREDVLIFDTTKGDILLLVSADINELEYEPQIVSEPNNDMKEYGKSMLGSPTLLK